MTGLLLGAAWGLGAAGLADYVVRAWQAEDGLPLSTVAAVAQTRDGYVWVGTYAGLARFDGVRFTVFDSSTTPGMQEKTATSLFEAEDGTLWIGHSSGELTCYRNGRFEAVALPAGWPEGRIFALRTDAAGDLWAINVRGLVARLRDGLVLTAPSGSASGLLVVARSKTGTIWVGHDGRLSQLEGGRLTPVELPEGASAYVHGICASEDGGLWVASSGRLRKWRGTNLVEDLGPAPWGRTPVTSFVETKAGELAAGNSSQGFFLLRGRGNEPGTGGGERRPELRTQAWDTVAFNRGNGFASDWVTALREDREGGLWVGTSGAGLCYVRSRRVQTVSPPDGWQGRGTLTVSPGRDGALWVGTEGAGIYRYQQGNWENFGAPSGPRLYIWSVAEDAQGTIWAGTWGTGLLARRAEGFEQVPGLEGAGLMVSALLPSARGGLWVGTGAGLLRYENGRTTWYWHQEGGPLPQVRAIVESGDGTVWFGTAGAGLGCLNPERGQPRLYRKQDGLASDFIECLRLDNQGALWIGTSGAGLNRFKEGRFGVVNKQHGLPDNTITHLEEDEEGFLWMGSYGGLIRASKTELELCAAGELKRIHCLAFGVSDGMPTLKCSAGAQPAGCRSGDGRLWFPTAKGLVCVDPQPIHTNALPPPVVIETMLLNEQIFEPGDQSGGGKAAGNRLRIPPGRHRLEFQYTALSFMAPERVCFRYRLEGLESTWVEAGTKRLANYSYVPPGEYTFRVTACNNDGVWNDTGAALAFTVLPYFWQTLWFRLLCVGVLVAASGGLVWFDTRRRMRRKLERSERQRAIEYERSRIARDIHDDLGSHLTRITMLSESADNELDEPARAGAALRVICDTARELTRAMDEIVWAVNPRHDTLEGLLNYLEKFAQDFLHTAGIRCRLDLPEAFPAWPLNAEVRHNLFLAFKEALNNAVRHAAASEVRVALTLEPGGLALAVQDNGCGFSAGARAGAADRFASGDGLENMRRRLAGVGGHCEIHSAPGQGTKVVFRIKAQPNP